MSSFDTVYDDFNNRLDEQVSNTLIFEPSCRHKILSTRLICKEISYILTHTSATVYIFTEKRNMDHFYPIWYESVHIHAFEELKIYMQSFLEPQDKTVWIYLDKGWERSQAFDKDDMIFLFGTACVNHVKLTAVMNDFCDMAKELLSLVQAVIFLGDGYFVEDAHFQQLNQSKRPSELVLALIEKHFLTYRDWLKLENAHPDSVYVKRIGF